MKNKIAKLINELIEAGIVLEGDRDTATNSLEAGKSWSTGIEDDKGVWATAEAIAESHGFAAEVDDSASSVDFIIRPAK